MKLMGSVNDTDCFIISNELLFTQLFEKTTEKKELLLL